MSDKIKIGVLGAGTMGRGIAQVAAQAEYEVVMVDVSEDMLEAAKAFISKMLLRQAEKGRISEDQAQAAISAIQYSNDLSALKNADLVIEAVVEDLKVKHECFKALDSLLGKDLILATNTSSLSVTEIAAVCASPERVIGLHFFNPVPLMPLVEVVKAHQSNLELAQKAYDLMLDWGKQPVFVSDTPGFIVNRVARPFYSEAIRIYEEGLADFATIDAAMRSRGFRMGPFQLMDLIGNDINFAVTNTVYEACFYEPRYRPSQTQKTLVAAGHLGKKSGQGYYEYAETANQSDVEVDSDKAKEISDRIIAMLINEAADAVYYKIADAESIDIAVTKGVNYPKGLCRWCDELGVDTVLDQIQTLYGYYQDQRYRPSVLLKQLSETKGTFY